MRATIDERMLPEAIGNGRPVVELIRDLRERTISGRSLDGASRRACVAYLGAEGYGVPEIAVLLGISDRTVARDRARVREELSVERDEHLLPRTVGQLMAEAESVSVRLRRIARDRSTPANTRVEAEKATWGVLCDLVRLLQGLGYLPQAPRPVRVSARLSGMGDDDDLDAPALEELMSELTRIEGIAKGSPALHGADSHAVGEQGEGEGRRGEQPTELTALRLDLGRLAVAARMSAVERLIGTATTQGRDTHEDDELEHEHDDDGQTDNHERTNQGAEPQAQERSGTKRAASKPKAPIHTGKRRARSARAG